MRFVIVFAFSSTPQKQQHRVWKYQPFMTFVCRLPNLPPFLRHNSYFKVIFPSITIEDLKPSCSPSKPDKKKRKSFPFSLLIALIKTFNKRGVKGWARGGEGGRRMFSWGSHVCSSNNRKKTVSGRGKIYENFNK